MKHLVIAIVMPLAACSGPDVACLVDDQIGGGVSFSSTITPAVVNLELPVESGGPLRCQPSRAPCEALEACVGNPVELVVGIPATLNVDVVALGDQQSGEAVIFDATLSGSPSFSMPSRIGGDGPIAGAAYRLSVAVTPTAGRQEAELRLVNLFAANAPSDDSGVGVTLVVDGVAAAR